MIQGIIFSKDRALQLDATLSSFFKHCKNANDVELVVLYKVTDEIHARQYTELKITYSNVQFVEQHDFRQDVVKILDPYIENSLQDWIYKTLLRLPPRFVAGIANWTLPRLEEKFILFLVDDNLFVRDFDIREIIDDLQKNLDAIGFSLRLGSNTTFCYVLDCPQPLPEFVFAKKGILKYAWTDAILDFGYPFDISSSIYRLGDFLPILMSVRFDNPNLLEGNMAFQKAKFAKALPAMLCYETSVTFCNPINRVQDISENRAGVEYFYSSYQLAELFDKGYRINTEAYNNFVPNSCHQEIELTFRKDIN